MTSEDGVSLSPGLTRVQYTSPPSKMPTLDLIMSASSKRNKPTDSADDYEEIDTLDGVDPAMALPARMLSKHQPSGSPTAGTSTNGSPVGHSRPSTGSTSSDGFATPPPTLPPRSQVELLGVSDGDVTETSTSFRTVNESFDQTDKEHREGEPTRDVKDMTDEEIQKLVNTPISLSHHDQPQVALLSNTNAKPQKIPALPSEMRSWKFKATTEPESDDDDFVNSTELQEMLMANQKDKPTTMSSEEKQDRSSMTPSPPPLPNRGYTLSITRQSTAPEDGTVKLPAATVVGQLSKQTVVPPLHVRNVTGLKAGLLYSEHEIEGECPAVSATEEGKDQRTSWLYSDDLDVDETAALVRGQSANENGPNSKDADSVNSTMRCYRL